jgi:hypothetical protein
MNEKAIAYVYGSAEYPRLQGRVTFHQIQDGVLITAEVHGLPVEQDCSGEFSVSIFTRVMFVQEILTTLLQTQAVITILQTVLTHTTLGTCHHFFQTMDMPLCLF